MIPNTTNFSIEAFLYEHYDMDDDYDEVSEFSEERYEEQEINILWTGKDSTWENHTPTDY